MKITHSILILIVTYFLIGLAPNFTMASPSTIASPIASAVSIASAAPIASTASTASTASKKTQVPKVVVSIPPFYAIVSEIMQGVGKPTLLIAPGGSSHHAVLSPSTLKFLEDADLVFWGGPDLETFLIHPLEAVNTQKTKIVQLDKTPGLHWLDTRFSANYSDETASTTDTAHDTAQDEHEHHEHSAHENHQHQHAHEHNHKHEEHGHQHNHATHAHTHGPKDMHFWLDPDNGLVLIDTITAALNEAYPEGRRQFEKNSKALKNTLKKLDKNLKTQLRPIQGKPYLVLHDGYQYFEKHYKLKAVGAITHHPELPISVARMQKIREMISQDKVECIFTEPGTSPKLIESLAKEYHLRMGELNPMERPEKGDYRYEHLFLGLSQSLLQCLEQDNTKVTKQR